MTRMERAQARSEIQHLVTSWTVSCDRNSPAEWVWAEDAVVFAPGGVRIEGRGNIIGRFRGESYSYTTRSSDTPIITDKPPIAPASMVSPAGEAAWLRHNLTTTVIAFDSDDSATGLIYFLVISGGGPTGSGRYEDRYRKVDGEWRIAERKTRLEFIPVGEQWDPARAIAAADRQEDANIG